MSYIGPPSPRGNIATEHFRVGTGHDPPPDLKAAYAYARGVVRNVPDALGGKPGHRIFWVRRGAFGGSTLFSHPDAFLVVGRHTQCGLVLPDDPFVALRHLLIRSILLPSGKVALRVLDLHTETAFILPDGSRQTSVFAEGPVAVAVGEYALVGLPAETPDDALPNDLPVPEVETPREVRDQIKAMEQALSPYRANAKPTTNRVSRITLMPRLVMLGDAAPPSLGLLTGGAGARWAVTLERGGRSATVSVTADDLTGGVVIGRSEKCHSEELRQITDNNTSRVHLLLLREGDRVHAFDLASTQGTHHAGIVTRRADLADGGTILLLGRGDAAVRLFWRRLAP